MVDYLSLQNSTENPTFMAILFTVLLSFLLASLIAYTYKLTSRQVYVPTDFLQSLIMVSIVAATVIQAIGDSVARGLGILGAMAIIHYRTNMRTPRNMAFLFAALAAGIACGVYGFVIGIIGTVSFCLVALVLRYSPLSRANNLVGVLRFEIPKSSNDLPSAEAVMSNYCVQFVQMRCQIGGKKKKMQDGERNLFYEYHIKLRADKEIPQFDNALAELGSLQALRLNFEDVPESV